MTKLSNDLGALLEAVLGTETDPEMRSLMVSTANALLSTDIDRYAELTDTTAVYQEHVDSPIQGLMYLALGLNGEAGEVAEVVKKAFRAGRETLPPDAVDHLIEELGGVFWYLAQMCRAIGVRPSEVLRANLEQLRERAEQGRLAKTD